MNRTVTDLERYLAEPVTSGLDGPPDLDRIRRLGARRRRTRHAAVALATSITIAAVAGGGYTAHQGLTADETDRDLPPVAQSPKPAPSDLSPIAKRVLREIPGAVKVSPWQVVIPGPGVAEAHAQKVTRDQIAAGPLPLGGASYTGVTAFPPSKFPRWLYEEVQRIEREELGNGNTYPVGSTDMGILVQYGDAELACLVREEETGPYAGRCDPAVLTSLGGDRYLQWSMGTDRFLKAGAEMEVFLTEDYSDGALSTIAIAGIHGTEVARADFITTTGKRAVGTVQAGTVVPHDSIFYTKVPGELARVVAYDTDGTVIEDHPLKSCNNPIDCEVR